jgi:diguanylate cyclase (GGDEF)-like protein
VSSSGTSRAHLDGVLKQIWEISRPDVNAQLVLVEQAVAAAVAGELGDDQRELAAREAHKLAGSVGTLGFATASQRARELEIGLGAATLEPGSAERLVDAVRECRNELFGADPATDAASEPGPAPASSRTGVDGRDPEPLDLLIIDDDGPPAQQILAEAKGRGLASALAADVASARQLLTLQTPAIVLLDLALREGVESALDILTETAQDRPVIVITDPGQSVDRVEVARRGGRGFLPHSLSATATVDAVISLRQRVRPVGTRVLAVDDDPVMLAAIKAALHDAGLDPMACEDPARFWALLEEHEPDLVILDFDMPGITGPELCRALRNDQRWASVPVLFLTSRGSPNAIHEMFDAGADDYVRKPFVGPELLARIFNRLERVQLYRTLADVDALTGALNRRRSVEDIERLLRMAARATQPLSLCILDIDNFKTINDGHGHPAGDAVLRGVGAALHRFLRGDDVIARWGGDEFVIAMYGMSGEDGRQRIGEFLEEIRRSRFDQDGAVPVTMSAGLAECPTDAASLESLYRAADEALYIAKEEGRDHVVHTASRRADGPDVLIVENDAALGGRIEQALQTRGYRTRWITDSHEAAAVLAGDGPIPAPVVLLGGEPSGQGQRQLLQLISRDKTLEHCRVILLPLDASNPGPACDAPEPMIRDQQAHNEIECVTGPLDLPALMQLIRPRSPGPTPKTPTAASTRAGSRDLHAA